MGEFDASCCGLVDAEEALAVFRVKKGRQAIQLAAFPV
jgi:hypothetical protein